MKSTGGGGYLRDSELLFGLTWSGTDTGNKGTRMNQGGTVIGGKCHYSGSGGLRWNRDRKGTRWGMGMNGEGNGDRSEIRPLRGRLEKRNGVGMGRGWSRTELSGIHQ